MIIFKQGIFTIVVPVCVTVDASVTNIVSPIVTVTTTVNVIHAKRFLTCTTSWMIQGVVTSMCAGVQVKEALVFECGRIGRTNRLLVRRTAVVAYATGIKGIERFANGMVFTGNISARVKILQRKKQKNPSEQRLSLPVGQFGALFQYSIFPTPVILLFFNVFISKHNCKYFHRHKIEHLRNCVSFHLTNEKCLDRRLVRPLKQ